jgi:hypothetical protein
MKNVKKSKHQKVKMAAALAAVLLAAAPVGGQQVVAKLDGTSRSTFKVGATSAAPLSLQNVSGRLTLGNGLRVSGGTVDFSGATISGFSLTSGSLTGVTIDNSVIGGSTPAAGTFTSLTSASGALNGTIGATTPAAGTFTTINSSGQITNTVSTGTTPLVVSSTTHVPNLNADRVDSLDFSGVSDARAPLIYTGSGSVGTPGAVTLPGSGSKLLLLTSGDSIVFYGGTSTPGQILITNSSDGFTLSTLQGDASVNSAGSLTIATGAVTSGKILDGTIAAGDLASNSVTTAKITDSNVTTAKIADGNVTLAKMAASSVDSNAIVNATIAAVDLSSAVKTWTPKPRIVATGAEAADTIRVSIVASSEDDAWLSSAQYMMSWVLLTTAADPTTVYGGSPTVAYVDGKAWQTITANKQAWAYTDTTGQLTLDVTITGDVTVYLSVSLAGKTTFATLDFN